METIITVKNLSKSYDIGKKEKDAVFRDVIINTFLLPYRLLFGKRKVNANAWALRGVSFEVKKGEVLGIIGKNGVGKSTLLKILSRITEPTGGMAILKGRVGSLIEVGTGFHQELTGRENIYLNGAILGMKKKEVDSKFNEIVNFSGIERYLDVPVKKYSSGMYVRLAFAVAAHLDTDILLVDEVLSVGDVEFQQKSLDKVKDIASGGRTVIFVSHNMSVINQLCTRCLVLSNGKIIFDGDTEKAISHYLASEYEYFGHRHIKRDKKKVMQLRGVSLINKGGTPSGIVDIGKPIQIVVEYDVNRDVSHAVVYAKISSVEGVEFLKSTDKNGELRTRKAGKYKSFLEIPQFLINTGRYVLSAGCEIPDKNLVDTEVFDEIDAFQFECVDSSGTVDEHGSGILAPKYRWHTEKVR